MVSKLPSVAGFYWGTILDSLAGETFHRECIMEVIGKAPYFEIWCHPTVRSGDKDRSVVCRPFRISADKEDLRFGQLIARIPASNR